MRDPTCPPSCGASSDGRQRLPLILITLVLFTTVGLVSRHFGGRQQTVVVVIAVALAVVQLTLPRYL
jgi:hypothetical protein